MTTERTTQAGSSGDGLKVGDEVEVVNYDQAYDGQRATITGINPCYPGKSYQLATIKFHDHESRYCFKTCHLRRIPPAQAEPVPATTLPNWPPGAVADITAALDAEFERKVEAKEPWKPVVGQKVLVEAVVRTVWEDEYEGDTTIRVKWKDGKESWGIVNISQLRPLPVVQGEGDGK